MVLPNDRTSAKELTDTAIHYSLPSAKFLHIYPNPTSGEFILYYGDDHAEEIKIPVFNNTGQEVGSFIRKSVNHTASTVVTWNNTLPSGLYYVKVFSTTNSYSAKLILLRK